MWTLIWLIPTQLTPLPTRISCLGDIILIVGSLGKSKNDDKNVSYDNRWTLKDKEKARKTERDKGKKKRGKHTKEQKTYKTVTWKGMGIGTHLFCCCCSGFTSLSCSAFSPHSFNNSISIYFLVIPSSLLDMPSGGTVVQILCFPPAPERSEELNLVKPVRFSLPGLRILCFRCSSWEVHGVKTHVSCLGLSFPLLGLSPPLLNPWSFPNFPPKFLSCLSLPEQLPLLAIKER